jgi:hypothetical protein
MFASLYINKLHKASLDLYIERWMDEVFADVPRTVSAAVFPKSVRATCWSKHDKYAYPGAAVFIKKA